VDKHSVSATDGQRLAAEQLMVDHAATPSRAWDPDLHPGKEWAALTIRTDEDRAVIAAATRQTDRVWIALHNGLLGGPTPVIPPRDDGWRRMALSAVEVLRASGAYRYLATRESWACAAAPPVLTAWLNAPADSATTMAEQLGVGEAFHSINADTLIAHLSAVVHAAQAAARFGIPDHDITLTTIPGPEPAVRVVVDSPRGVSLASPPVPLASLIDDQTHGVDRAVIALTRIADVVDRALAAYRHAVWHDPPAVPDALRASTARGFPEMIRTEPDLPPTPPSGPSAVRESGRRPR
jgi:hypothetical protein